MFVLVKTFYLHKQFGTGKEGNDVILPAKTKLKKKAQFTIRFDQDEKVRTLFHI